MLFHDVSEADPGFLDRGFKFIKDIRLVVYHFSEVYR